MFEGDLTQKYQGFNQTTTATNGNIPYAQEKSLLQKRAIEAETRKKKDERAYSLERARAFYNNSLPYRSELIDKFKELEAYATAQQDMAKYSKDLQLDERGSAVSKNLAERKLKLLGLCSGGNPDKIRFKYLPTIIDAIVGRIVPINRDVIVTADDATAKNKRAQVLAMAKAANYMKANTPQHMMQYGDTSPAQPEEEKSLPVESVLTEAINKILNIPAGGWQDTEKKITRTTIKQGLGGVKLFVTPNHTIGYRAVDLMRLFVEAPTKDDFSDVKNIGEVITMPICDLIALDRNGEYTEEDWKKVPSVHGRLSTTNSEIDYSQRVDVLDFEWIDKDPEDGMMYTYGGLWIINSDIILDYGLNPFQLRGQIAKGEYEYSRSSFILNTPYLSGLKIDSLVNRITAAIEGYQMCKINFFLEIMMIDPSASVMNEGYLIFLDEMFNKMVDGTWKKSDDKINTIELAKDLRASGLVIIPDSKITATGQVLKAEPPYTIQGGLTDAVMNWLAQASNYLAQAKELMGVPDGVAPSMPNKDQTVNAQRSAASSSQAVLSLISDNSQIVFTKLCERIAMLIPLIASRHRDGIIKYTGISNWFSEEGMAILADIDTIYNHSLGFTVKASPTNDQLAQFEETLATEVSKGAITSAQRIRFSQRAKNNIEDAITDLEESIHENANAQRQHEMAIQEQNAKGNAEAATIARNAQLENTKMEGKNMTDKVDKEWQMQKDLLETKHKHEAEMEEKRLKNERLKLKVEILKIKHQTNKPTKK